MAKPQSKRLVACVSNEDYPASLERGKIYVALRDKAAERLALIRVIDESGEGYLFPSLLFRLINLPHATKNALLSAIETQ